MENNWPETVDELLGECQRLISKYDLYTLGERGKPFTGETEARVDGTEYLAGEYQYGVAMIPAQWVTHVIDAATLGNGKLTAEQVRRCVRVGACDHGLWEAIDEDTDWQAIADELNAVIGGGECEGELRESGWGGYTRHCGACGADLDCDTRNRQNFCPNCGRKVKR